MTPQSQYEQHQCTGALGVLWIGRGSPIWASPWRLDFYDRMDWPFLQTVAVAVLLLGGSIAVAAFMSWMIFGPQNRTSSLFGAKPVLAVLMAIVPISVVAVVGYENDFGMNPHLAGAAMAGLLVLYALGEEIGWRGYMNDALSPAPYIVRGLLIGVAWWAWHFWFLDEGSTMQEQIQLLAILTATSFLFISIVGMSRSWLSVAAFHSVAHIGILAGAFDVPTNKRLWMGGIALVILIAIHSYWQHGDKKAASR